MTNALPLMSSDCLLPSRAERVSRARADLAMGMPCILTTADDCKIIAPLETIAADRFTALGAMLGDPILAITAKRAEAVMPTHSAVQSATGPVRIRPPSGAPLDWYLKVADTQFDRGTHPIGPLHMLRGAEEPIYDAALSLIKSAQLIPAFVVYDFNQNSPAVAQLPFARLDAADAIAESISDPTLVPVATAGLPLEVHAVNRLHVFRDPDGLKEHYAVQIGRVDPSRPVLTRLHSACFTGDVLGSLKCDCGPQLQAAMSFMGAEGGGLLLYLNQEGRGIGLANKMRVYDLQSRGLDTVEANHHLGFEDDERDFRIAAVMLRKLGISTIRLLTNNPNKVAIIEGNGITVAERLPLAVGRRPENDHYLNVKALKSGHFL